MRASRSSPKNIVSVTSSAAVSVTSTSRRAPSSSTKRVNASSQQPTSQQQLFAAPSSAISKKKSATTISTKNIISEKKAATKKADLVWQNANAKVDAAKPPKTKAANLTTAKTKTEIVKKTAQKNAGANTSSPKNPDKQSANEKSGEVSTAKTKVDRKEVAVSKVAISTAETATIKAKRSRVPADFASRYGENRREKAAPIATATERKARKTAQQREQLRQLMTPDDDLVQRLQRATTISSSAKFARKPRRKNHWESRCGKCGATSQFTTPAALCAKCGAIAVRVLD